MAEALPTRHYEKLRAYVFAVLKDMIERGKIRRAHGQELDKVLQIEGASVLSEMEGDLRRLGSEMGLSLFGAIHDAIMHTAEHVASDGRDTLMNFFFGGKKK